MATRLKTVQYAFPALASLANNTLTNLTQITVYLPESGTKTFRSVVARVSMDDIVTATGGTVTTKTVNLRLGAAAYTSVSNTNSHANSGESISWHVCQDFTSHFTTNWSGTSMTCAVQLQFNQTTGTTLGFVNVCCTLEITYEYDDTSTTQLKTVMIPLNAPVATVTTSAVTYDTAPALDTYLPESSKTYRNVHVVVQGNEHKVASTTDRTLTINYGASTITTGNYEAALASSRFFRYVWSLTAAGWSATGSTQAFQLQASVAGFNHVQAWLVVTYEFDASATTAVMNSVLLPLDFASPMGGTTSSDYQRATRLLWVEEPATITLQRCALFAFWDSISDIAGLNFRLGTGSFVAYTDTASTFCGSNAAMIRNDAPTGLSFGRGRNTFVADVYRTDGADVGTGVSGFLIVNYTSGKASAGVGAHNHTVLWNMRAWDTTAPTFSLVVAAKAPNAPPESNYFITALGFIVAVMSAGTVTPAGLTLLAERLSGEGGIQWEPCYLDIGISSAEVGARFSISQSRDLFKRFPTDYDSERIDLFTARRYRSFMANVATSQHMIDWCVTYHSITYTCAGTISGFSGTVTLSLHRATDGEKVQETTRSGDGAYSFTWYDNTEEMFVTATDGSGHVGRCPDTLAA